jgi:hypothetical protein
MLRLPLLGLMLSLYSYACVPNPSLEYPQIPTSFDESAKDKPLQTRLDAEIFEKDQNVVDIEQGVDMMLDMTIPVIPTTLKTSSVQWISAPLDRPGDGVDPTRLKAIEGSFLWHLGASPILPNTP